jgi:hypothetical protein
MHSLQSEPKHESICECQFIGYLKKFQKPTIRPLPTSFCSWQSIAVQVSFIRLAKESYAPITVRIRA